MRAVHCQELNYRLYNNHDGLAQMQINGLGIGGDDKILIATRGGICSFNGESFDRYEDVSCLPYYTMDIAQDEHGIIWILTSNSLISFDGMNCQEYPITHEVVIRYRTKLTVLSGSKLLINNSQNQIGPQMIFSDGQYYTLGQIYKETEGKNIENIAYNRYKDETYLLASNSELFVYKGDSLITSRCLNLDKIRFNTHMWDATYADSISSIYAVTGDGLALYTFETIDSLHLNCTHTNDGLHQYQDEAIIRHNSIKSENQLLFYPEGIDEPIIIDHLKEKFNYYWNSGEFKGNLWGKTDRGLLKIMPEIFISFKESELPNIWSVISSGGEMFFSGYELGIKKWADNKISSITTRPTSCALHNNSYNLKDIYFRPSIDKQGVIYWPFGIGLLKKENDFVIPFYYNCNEENLTKGLSSAALCTHMSHDDEYIVTGNCDGVRWIDKKGKLQRKLTRDRLLNESCILTIAQQSDSEYWFGGRPHLIHYDYKSDSLRHYNLSSVFSKPKVVIYSCDLDSNGRLWIGTNEGLAYYDEDQDSILLFPAFKNQVVSAVLDYSPEKLFVSLGDGIAMINAELFTTTGQIQYQLFNQHNGFMGIEPNQNGLYLDHLDRLWVTSASHLSYTYPRTLNYQNKEILTVDIKKVNKKRTLLGRDTTVLPDEENNVTFEYEAIGYHRPNKIVYSHRLKEYDNQWSEWHEAKQAQYTALRSGHYEFQVKAKDAEKEVDPIHVSRAAISVDIPYYKEPQFTRNLLILTTILMLLILFSQYRNRNLKKEKSLLAEIQQLKITENNRLNTANQKLKNENKLLLIELQTPKPKKLAKTLVELDDKHNIAVLPADISYLSAMGNQVYIVMRDGEQHRLWQTLKATKARLPQEMFCQVNRSKVINIDQIRSIDDHQLVMHQGTIIDMSKSGRNTLISMAKRSKIFVSAQGKQEE